MGRPLIRTNPLPHINNSIAPIGKQTPALTQWLQGIEKARKARPALRKSK